MCAYNTLFSGTGKLNTNEGIAISRNDYNNSYTLYAFDFTTDLGKDNHFNFVKNRTFILHSSLPVLPYAVTVIVYAEFDNVIDLDRNRNVLADFRV